MNKLINRFTFFFILILALSFLFVFQAGAQQWCDLCAMDLHKYRLTKYILTLDNKTLKYTCSLHCAAIVINNNNVIKTEVSDYATGYMIDAGDGYYVVNSDIKGVMSKISKLAFTDKSQAEKFIIHHGGTLTKLNGALKIVNQNIEQDMCMLKDKILNLVMLGQNVAEARGCFACHVKDGSKGMKESDLEKVSCPAWNTEAFAVKMNTKAKIKEAIITGKHQTFNNGIKKIEKQNDNILIMPSWEKVIKGKELHALTNYIWSLRHKKQK